MQEESFELVYAGHDWCKTHQRLGGYCREKVARGCIYSALFRKVFDEEE